MNALKPNPSDSPDPHDPHITPALEKVLSGVLTAGVIAAAITAIIGGALFLSQRGGETTQISPFVGQPSWLTSPLAIVPAALHADALAVMQLSVLILIATPVVRVACSLVLFVMKRDGLYVAVTLVVLALLAVGLFGVAT